MREFEQAAAVLPPELRQQALALSAQERERAEELLESDTIRKAYLGG